MKKPGRPTNVSGKIKGDLKEEATRLKNVARDMAKQANLIGNKEEKEKQDEIFHKESQREVKLNAALVGVLGEDSGKLTAKYLLETNTENSIRQLLPLINGLRPADVLEVALKAPGPFINDVLSEIGVTGRGLIDKTFSGNVFDDEGTATGRILFTGESGVNSHSWLEVDGRAFDPVLGISGTVDEVETNSTFMKFDWKITDLVGVGADGWYFIKDDPSIIKTEKPRLAVAPNPMSFNTAYYLTKSPELHLKPEVLTQLET